MNLSERDQKALKYLSAALLLASVIYFWPESTATQAAGVVNATEVLEKRLARSRALLMQVPDKQALLKQAQTDLSVREKGMLAVDSPESN